MNNWERPYFVVEGNKTVLPKLGISNPERNRRNEYTQLFDGQPCYAPVLALTIFTADSGNVDEVLVAVRDPKTNAIHPNVVSTPTKRIPPATLINIASSQVITEQTSTQHVFQINGPSSWHTRNNTAGCQLELNQLLEQKLGVKPENDSEDTTFNYAAVVHSLTLGDSRVGVTPQGHDIIEKVAMLNVLVRINSSQKERIPPSTSHYNQIRWVTPDEYRHMQDARDLLPIFGTAAVELCIHGVCIATSRVALDDIDSVLSNQSPN